MEKDIDLNVPPHNNNDSEAASGSNTNVNEGDAEEVAVKNDDEMEASNRIICPYCFLEFRCPQSYGGHVKIHYAEMSKPNISGPNLAQDQEKKLPSKKALKRKSVGTGSGSGSGSGSELLRNLEGWKVKGKRGQNAVEVSTSSSISLNKKDEGCSKDGEETRSNDVVQQEEDDDEVKLKKEKESLSLASSSKKQVETEKYEQSEHHIVGEEPAVSSPSSEQTRSETGGWRDDNNAFDLNQIPQDDEFGKDLNNIDKPSS